MFSVSKEKLARMPQDDLYLAYKNVPISQLKVKEHFDTLTKEQKLYAHHLSRACWFGSRIVLAQVSSSSVDIYNLIMELFSPCADEEGIKLRIAELKKCCDCNEESVNDFVSYAVQILGNLGNYKSFGDTKFIPRLKESEFRKIVKCSGNQKALELYEKVSESIYSLHDSELLLGFPSQGHYSAYYSSDMTKEEIDLVNRYMEQKHVNAYNTRVFKLEQEKTFSIKVASAEKRTVPKEQFEGVYIQWEFGDYSEEMTGIVRELQSALKYVANDIEKKMIEKYIESFQTGSIEAHKDSQRYWIKDISPKVETNIGFIESYRDPAGVRGEWEGFVSIVNQEQTKKFESLVNNAKAFISKLPWGVSFEKDEFRKPDFTSLEVLAFCTSGIPAGINIPNYDDIRMNDGFKNVSLGNVLNSPKASTEVTTFLSPEDVALFDKYKSPAFEVQVGIHELLGHGSGKLFEESRKGVFNFDPKNPPVNPLTQKPITSWYKPGETFGSKLGNFASSYEECRAESCGIFLSVEKDVLKIFGHECKEAEDVYYVNWLLMVRAGLLGLEFYDAEKKQWGQAHMRGNLSLFCRFNFF